jgi:putative ABC transport system ATP-binding protein
VILRVRGVTKSYAHATEPVEVLKGVDFEAEAAKTVAIVGPSGSGKSTLLSLLAGLDSPDQGSIEIGGKDLATLGEEALTRYRAAQLGIVFQQFHLMTNLTAHENVRLPLEIAGDAEADAKAAKALVDVGLGGRGTHFPHELSGGECQRVAIARALVVKPPLLLADEPSGNLDTKTGEQVMRLLFDLVRDSRTALVLVTHNDELARRCDRRVTLTGGRLVQTEAP